MDHFTSLSHNNGLTQLGNGHSNGLAVETSDGAEYAAGGAGYFKPLWDGSNHDRREFVRLTLQALHEIGYTSAAAALEAESGFTLESETVTNFRNGVLQGSWSEVERLVLQLPQDEVVDLPNVRFLIRQQKFLEALERKDTKLGLRILRNELTPLVSGTPNNRLHFLSSLIMCPDTADLKATAEWEGLDGGSREKLLQTLQLYISPSLMIPQRRLGQLLDQAQEHQRLGCLFHAGDVPISLLADCRCDSNTFPSITTHVLQDHTDEVWRIAFSHNGDWLCSAGKDNTAILYKVKDNFALETVLTGHGTHIACVAWSPDDSMLLTAADKEIRMWRTETGACIEALEKHEYQITSLCWQPDGKGFISGGMDGRVQGYDLAGNVTFVLPRTPSRVVDLAVSPNGRQLVTTGRVDVKPFSTSPSPSSRASSVPTSLSVPIQPRHEKRLSVYNLATKTLEYEIPQVSELTSLVISRDSRFAIVAHGSNEVLLVDLQDGKVIQRYHGCDSGSFVTQSCFGGSSDNFILRGGADGQIYVWHRDTAELVHTLSGHGPGQVNAVAWTGRGMFATASDDRTVRVWGVRPQHELGRAPDGGASGAQRLLVA